MTFPNIKLLCPSREACTLLWWKLTNFCSFAKSYLSLIIMKIMVLELLYPHLNQLILEAANSMMLPPMIQVSRDFTVISRVFNSSIYIFWCMLFLALFTLLFFFCLFDISWGAPAAYGGSQARGLIGGVATSLLQSHSNAGSEPRLQPSPQLMATPDR